MYPQLFGVRYLNTYGICIAIGLVLCFAIGRYYARVKQISRSVADFAEGNAYVAIGVGILVSVVGQAFFFYREDPSGGFRLTTAATFASGLVGGIASFLMGYLAYGRRKYGPRLIEAFPIVPVCITIAHAFGRLGCFFAGCCYGRPTDSILGVNFPNLGHKAYPTQLFESAFLFLLFLVLYHLAFKRDCHQNFTIYLFAYGTFRFFIEFIRGDERGALVGSLSPSQFMSILMVTASLGVYFLTKYLVKRYRENFPPSERIAI